ncbi:MAG: hypothetical protein QG653_618 [Patescibacteria group bacterium]|nr:hypothetical protein [Patescibacteria group bacterium]
MKEVVQKTFQVIGLLTTLLLVVYLIFSLITNYNDEREKEVNYTPQTNSVVVPNIPATSTPVSEDGDVYEQRQMRADFNSGATDSGN